MWGPSALLELMPAFPDRAFFPSGLRPLPASPPCPRIVLQASHNAWLPSLALWAFWAPSLCKAPFTLIPALQIQC